MERFTNICFLGPEATIFHSNISVTHNKLAQRTQRNLRIYEKLIAQGNKLSQRDLFHFADELLVNESYEKSHRTISSFIRQTGARP